MALTDEAIRRYTQKLLYARMNLVMHNPFFGSLLMHVKLSVDENCDTAYTDSKIICFGTKFLDELTDSEVEFVMMHEVMHIALQHCRRGDNFNQELFNIACDIVVNSIIYETNNYSSASISVGKYGESMHRLPDGSEGAGFTAEEVYMKLLQCSQNSIRRFGFSDNHSNWGPEKDGQHTDKIVWAQHIVEAVKTADRIDPGKAVGNVPGFARRLCEIGKSRCVDWKKLLHNFVSEEVSDYSFNPPDKRYSDEDYFLPDYNVSDGSLATRKVLFMVDTSGSIDIKEIGEFLSEIKYAKDIYDGGFDGWIACFDTEVYKPVRIDSASNISDFKPCGGGGTSFYSIFKYVKDKMSDELPENIVIFTDGCAPFPDEKYALGIPVLWVITNNIINPPWGKVARMC